MLDVECYLCHASWAYFKWLLVLLVELKVQLPTSISVVFGKYVFEYGVEKKHQRTINNTNRARIQLLEKGTDPGETIPKRARKNVLNKKKNRHLHNYKLRKWGNKFDKNSINYR